MSRAQPDEFMNGPSRHSFAAALTPRGRGAIGVIRVWGRGAGEAVDSVFRPDRGPGAAASAPGRLRLGRLGRGLGDEVVVARLPGGEPRFEIQCHGGPQTIMMILETLDAAGVRVVPSENLVNREEGSPIRAAARLDLVRSPTLRTAEVLLEQASGALDDEVTHLIAELGLRDHSAASRRIDDLLDRARLGARLVTGWRVVIVGRPNVGKSRLLNALTGYRRTIVSPTPGTTRDIVVAQAAFEGWPFELADTAGLRTTADELERLGIDRSFREQKAADLIVKVFDCSQPLLDDDRAILEGSRPSVVVASKIDLPAVWNARELEREASQVFTVSAERGDGIDELIRGVVQAVVPGVPPPGAGVPFREVQVEALRRARAAIAAGESGRAIAELRALTESTGDERY